jgi:hypothetical protein
MGNYRFLAQGVTTYTTRTRICRHGLFFWFIGITDINYTLLGLSTHNTNSFYFLCKHDEEKHSLMDAIHMSKHQGIRFHFHYWSLQSCYAGRLVWKLMDFDFLHSFESKSLLLHLLIFINVGSRFDRESREMWKFLFACPTTILVIMLSDFNNFSSPLT